MRTEPGSIIFQDYLQVNRSVWVLSFLSIIFCYNYVRYAKDFYYKIPNIQSCGSQWQTIVQQDPWTTLGKAHERY